MVPALRQDEERGLKGVLGIVIVVQHAAAHAQDERPVTRTSTAKAASSLSAAKRPRRSVSVRPSRTWMGTKARKRGMVGEGSVMDHILADGESPATLIEAWRPGSGFTTSLQGIR